MMLVITGLSMVQEDIAREVSLSAQPALHIFTEGRVKELPDAVVIVHDGCVFFLFRQEHPLLCLFTCTPAVTWVHVWAERSPTRTGKPARYFSRLLSSLSYLSYLYDLFSSLLSLWRTRGKQLIKKKERSWNRHLGADLTKEQLKPHIHRKKSWETQKEKLSNGSALSSLQTCVHSSSISLLRVSSIKSLPTKHQLLSSCLTLAKRRQVLRLSPLRIAVFSTVHTNCVTLTPCDTSILQCCLHPDIRIFAHATLTTGAQLFLLLYVGFSVVFVSSCRQRARHCS